MKTVKGCAGQRVPEAARGGADAGVRTRVAEAGKKEGTPGRPLPF